MKLMAIFRKVDFTKKKGFLLAEIETKFIVESVCQKIYKKNTNYINQALPSQTAKQVRNGTPNHKYVNKAKKSTLFLLQTLALTLFVM